MEGREIKMVKLIALQIKKALVNSGLTKAEVCRRANIKDHQLTSVLEGTRNYTIFTLTRLVIVLDIDFLLYK